VVLPVDKKFLSPKSDLIFKLLFGDERSSEILTAFLKSVLRLPEDDYDEVIIVNPFLLQEYDGDKLGILDVKVKTRTKKVIDIEIQLRIKPHFVERVVFYQSKMITEQVGAGKDFSKIQRVINIIITDEILIKDYEGGEGKYHHRISLCDVDTGYQFSNIKEINILELKKLPQTDDGTNLWAWMKFLNAESKEEMDMLVADRPQMKIGKAVARLEELSQDERARMLYESRQMMEWDIQLGQEAAKQEGHTLALQKVAQNLLAIGMSVTDVSSTTGLTSTEIESLRILPTNN